MVSSGGREVVLEYSGCEVVNPGSFAELEDKIEESKDASEDADK